MTAEQLWIIIGIVVFIAFTIGMVKIGYFFAQEQRTREQREYKPLQGSHSSTLDQGTKNSVQSHEPLIIWGDIEFEAVNLNSDTDLTGHSRSASAKRIRWGDDNSVTSNSPSVSTAHLDEEVEQTWASQSEERTNSDSETQISGEKRICPICKQIIDESTNGMVRCDGCDTYYHHKCIEDYEGICLICKAALF